MPENIFCGTIDSGMSINIRAVRPLIPRHHAMGTPNIIVINNAPINTVRTI
jgi:hypothetical protein